MTATTTPPREIGRSSATTLPNRWRDHPVEVKRALPGVIILVHGVNDLGTHYPALDNGLCMGLNERLDRSDLYPNDYTIPVPGEDAVADPDKIYFRLRVNNRSNSPVIPFYWGYRASEREIGRKRINGEVVDVHGNRLDRDFAKGGGMFANATSNIVDMFGGNFHSSLLVRISDKFSDIAHPLRQAPDRRYMALAARRLAALIDTIRRVDPDETITVVGHSQGCLISLLAQAWTKRPADCLILNHPPYGLHSPPLDTIAQSGGEQQTTHARVETLVNLVKRVCAQAHDAPPLEALLSSSPASKGRTGLRWTPHEGCRPAAPEASDSPYVTFAERDNRGKVYLYFCPHDLTVGLLNVAGIGTLGVPDTISYSIPGQRSEQRPMLSRLGPNFFQRIWTWRDRDGKRCEVGENTPYQHNLRLPDEPGYDASKLTSAARWDVQTNALRTITGEALNPSFQPDLHHGELPATRQSDPRYEGRTGFDPIDASIAVTTIRRNMVHRVHPELQDRHPLPTPAELAAEMNRGKEEGDRVQVAKLWRQKDGSVLVYREETPQEARKRIQDDPAGMLNSYHSSIIANQEHHRWVTAMDVAIGQGKALDNPALREILIGMADWRVNPGKGSGDPKPAHSTLSDDVRALVMKTWNYYKVGEFPEFDAPLTPPAAVVKESTDQRALHHLSSRATRSANKHDHHE